MKKFFLTIFILFILLLPVVTLAAKAQGLGAASGVLDTVGGKTGLGGELSGRSGMFNTLAKGLLGAVGTIFFFLTIYAGGLWLTAAGNEERITKAKTILFTCVIGLFITVSAYAITSFVTTRLGGAPSAAPPTTPSSETQQPVSCVNVGGHCINNCNNFLNEVYRPGTECEAKKQLCCKPQS